MRILMLILVAIVALSSCTINRISVSANNAHIVNSFNTVACEGTTSVIVELDDCTIHFNGTCADYSKWCASGHNRDVLFQLGYKFNSHTSAQVLEVYKP